MTAILFVCLGNICRSPLAEGVFRHQAEVAGLTDRFEVDSAPKGGRLGHLKIKMVLQGDYEDLRRFIYALETAPQFVIVDELSLAQNELNKPLTLTLALSTYYRLGGDAT